MLTSSQGKGGDRIAILDSLRGAAALAVLWHHLFVIFAEDFVVLKDLNSTFYDIGGWISDQNKNAVLLFFVLSGFAIRLAVRSSHPMDGPQLVHYAIRRALRILPLYWFALAWTATLGWLAFGARDVSFSGWSLAGNFLFLQTSVSASGNWFPPYGLNGPLWSLSYEAFYYVILPFAVAAAARLGGEQRSLPILVFGSLAISLLAIVINTVAPSPFSHFLAYWHVWVLGYALADAWKSGARTPYGPISLAIVALAILAARRLGLFSDTLETLRNGVALAAAAYLAVLMSGVRYLRTLTRVGSSVVNAFHLIGRGSYALYLLHYPLLLGLHAVLAGSAFFGSVARLAIAGAVAAAFALLVCPEIERRLGRLRPKALRELQQKSYS